MSFSLPSACPYVLHWEVLNWNVKSPQYGSLSQALKHAMNSETVMLFLKAPFEPFCPHRIVKRSPLPGPATVWPQRFTDAVAVASVVVVVVVLMVVVLVLVVVEVVDSSTVARRIDVVVVGLVKVVVSEIVVVIVVLTVEVAMICVRERLASCLLQHRTHDRLLTSTVCGVSIQEHAVLKTALGMGILVKALNSLATPTALGLLFKPLKRSDVARAG